MDEIFLKNPVNKDIVCLLIACKLPPMEKRFWLNLLPEMTDQEKEELRNNLKEEVDYEVKVEDQAITQFVSNLQQRIWVKGHSWGLKS